MTQVAALHYTPGGQQEIVLYLLSQRVAAAAGFRMSARLASNPAVQAGTFTAGAWSEVVPQNEMTVIQRLSVEAVVGEWSTATPDPNVPTGEYVMQRATRDAPAGFRRTAVTIEGRTNVGLTTGRWLPTARWFRWGRTAPCRRMCPTRHTWCWMSVGISSLSATLLVR